MCRIIDRQFGAFQIRQFRQFRAFQIRQFRQFRAFQIRQFRQFRAFQWFSSRSPVPEAVRSRFTIRSR